MAIPVLYNPMETRGKENGVMLICFSSQDLRLNHFGFSTLSSASASKDACIEHTDYLTNKEAQQLKPSMGLE